MRTNLCFIAAVVSGILMIFGGFAHAVAGWPAMAAALAEQGIDPNLAGALAVGWSFGSIAMLSMGVTVLLSLRALRRGVRDAFGIAMTAGLAYVVFGLGAFAYRFPNPHFLFFIVVGIMLCVSLFGCWRASACDVEPDSGSTEPS